MPYSATIYRVFIASPGDVPQERAIVRNTVNDWNAVHSAQNAVFLEPAGWETHSFPDLGARPQELINKQVLKDSDLLVAVFWTRLGTATGDHASGTVEEIEEHLAAGKPAMIYFSNAPVRLDSVDEAQYSSLKKFRSELEGRGLIQTFDDSADFQQKLARQLHQVIVAKFLEKGLSSESPSQQTTPLPERAHSLTEDAVAVLANAAKGDGTIMMLRHIGGLHIQISTIGTLDTSTPRLRAKWEGVIEELASGGYIRSRGGKGQLFDVAEPGYQLVEALGLNT